MTYTYEYYQASADYLKKLVPWTPDIGIILGSGLGPFAETLQDKIVAPYGDIPNFLVSTAPYQAGKLIFEPTQWYMEENMLFVFKNKVKLLPSGIQGKNAAILGASALIWQQENK